MTVTEDKYCFERELWAQGIISVAGVDEAGRGPLAGPVVAGAVILLPEAPIDGLDDSKKLSEKKRDILFDRIVAQSKAYGIGLKTPAEIDRHNILEASRLAMINALQQIQLTIQHVLIDGKPFRRFPFPFTAIIHGDSRSASIAAASILAKVTRDRLMLEFHKEFPAYNFARHKGYPTKAHLAALHEHGPCPIHRRSFQGVKEYFENFSKSYYNWKRAIESAPSRAELAKIGNSIARYAHTLPTRELDELRRLYQINRQKM